MKLSNILKVSILMAFLLVFIVPVMGRSNQTLTAITEDGDITDGGGGYVKDNTSTTIMWSILANNRGFIEFNTSTIPTNAIVDELYWVFKTQNIQSPGVADMRIYELTVQPSASGNQLIYDNVGNHTFYVQEDNLGNNATYTVDLGASARALFFNQTDWFAMGFYSTNGNNNFLFSAESVIPSHLLINFHLPSDSQYNISGAFYENGTRSTDPLTVVISGQNVTEEIILTGGVETVYFEEIPNFISWSIGSGITRRIRVREANTSFTIFLPEADFSQFAYTIKDYTSRIVSNDTWIESRRIVNGTEYIIEREIILNTINPIAFSQVLQRTYILDVVFSDNSTFRFGFFATLNDLTPTLLIKRAAFSRQVLLSYKFLFVEATRPADTQIQVIYNSTRGTTTLFEAQLFFRNGTFVQELNDTAENINLNFVGLDNETNYYVDVNMTHSLGTFKQTFPFQGASIFVAFPSLGNSTNTFAGLNGSAVIPTFMIIGSGLMFSAISAPAGALMTIMVAVGLQSVGALSIHEDFIVTGIVLAFILGFNRVRNR